MTAKSAISSTSKQRGGSQLSSAHTARSSSISGMPSTIRSSEPSAIVRHKLAELQLKLELERVLRLERENELENQRRINLELKNSQAIKVDH